MLAGAVRVGRTLDRVKAGYVPVSSHAFMEHDIGLEPTKPAWRAGVLPLHQSCAGCLDITYTSPGAECHTFELCNSFMSLPSLRQRAFSYDVCTHPCRSSGIRTHDLLNPNQARYQTALHPEKLPGKKQLKNLPRFLSIISPRSKKVF